MKINFKIGCGGEVTGKAKVFKEIVQTVDISLDLDGGVVVFFDSPTREVVEKCRFVGVSAVIVPEIHYRDFVYFQSLGDFVIIVIQKFGNEKLDQHFKEKFSHLDGKQLTVNGSAKEIETS